MSVEQSFDESKKNSAIEKSHSFDIKLYNEKGEIVKSSKSEEGKRISLDTQKLPNGTYYLHITEGKNVIKKQVIIQH